MISPVQQRGRKTYARDLVRVGGANDAVRAVDAAVPFPCRHIKLPPRVEGSQAHSRGEQANLSLLGSSRFQYSPSELASSPISGGAQRSWSSGTATSAGSTTQPLILQCACPCRSLSSIPCQVAGFRTAVCSVVTAVSCETWPR